MKLFLLVTAITALTYAGEHDSPSLTSGPAFDRLDADDALLVVINFQEGFIGAVQEIDIALYKHNMLATSALAGVFDFPVFISPTSPQGPFGPIPWELLAMQPNATIVDRDYTETNAWDNEEFREAVRRSGKSQVIVAGQTTDVCKLVSSCPCLRAEGYGVWVSAEATGTSSIFVRDLANQRMIHAGVHVVSIGSIMTELLSSELPDISAELQVEVRQWIDTYLPTIGSINRAHAHAVQDGVIHPGMKKVLSNNAA